MKFALILLLCVSPLAAQRIPIDHDACWTCWDSQQHFLSGAGIDVGFRALFPHTRTWHRIGFVSVVGFVWETAQADVAHSANLRGRGFGWGGKDFALDVLGAFAGEGLWQLGKRIL